MRLYYLSTLCYTGSVGGIASAFDWRFMAEDFDTCDCADWGRAECVCALVAQSEMLMRAGINPYGNRDYEDGGY